MVKKNSFFIKQFKKKLSYSSYKDLKSAVKQVLLDVKSNTLRKTILFSPAAASFDNFKNFEDRGQYFNYLLKKYNFKKYI